MMNKRKKISGGFVQDIEEEEIERQVSSEEKLDKNRSEKKICAKCGNTLKPKAKFCVECGTEIIEKLQYLKQQQMEPPVITKKKSVKVSNPDNSKTSALFEEIDYEQYRPFRWTTYIQVNEELDNVLTLAKEMETPNILIEADKGVGKTILAYEAANRLDCHIVSYSCSSGTREGDLRGRIMNLNGLFQPGILVQAIEIANNNGMCILHLDELNALEPELQKLLNPLLDDRRSINANGRMFKLNGSAKLIVIATMNPSTYAGTSPLNEDLRSRFVGQIWDYPKQSHLEKVIDWTDIPITTIKKPILQLAQDSFNYKVRGDVEYVLTIRDLKQFTELFRIWMKSGISSKRVLSKALEGAIYVKYSDRAERELMIKSACDTFPAQ